jgi:glycosyltransferase involved in cell wall biosynthesis
VTNAPDITMIIPTYNRRRALEAVWPSYAASNHVARIVVVDGGGTDGTPELVESLKATTPVPVTLIRIEKKQTVQESKMAGVAVADTEWVMFGEDDVWLRDDYTSVLAADARKTGADEIAGRIVTARVGETFDPSKLTDDGQARKTDTVADMTMIDADFAVHTAAPIAIPFLHAVALVRRSVFDRVSFDGTFRGNGWREETDLYLSLIADGGKVVFTPNTACYHLRGAISATGGQRIARWRVEYFAALNTLKLVEKHWPMLRRQYGYRGTPLTWTMGFMARREKQQMQRCMRGHRSTFRP